MAHFARWSVIAANWFRFILRLNLTEHLFLFKYVIHKYQRQIDQRRHYLFRCWIASPQTFNSPSFFSFRLYDSYRRARTHTHRNSYEKCKMRIESLQRNLINVCDEVKLLLSSEKKNRWWNDGCSSFGDTIVFCWQTEEKDNWSSRHQH